jgi:hypothetical protein
MNQELIQQIVDEILSSFEPLEAQSTAVMQFLKAKGVATDAELAPFLEQAANTANVRWRAVRVRAAALIANALKDEESKSAEKENKPAESPQPTAEVSQEEKTEPKARGHREESRTKENPEPTQESKPNKDQDRKTDSRKNQFQPNDEEQGQNSQLSNPPLFKTGRDKEKERGQEATPSQSGSTSQKPAGPKPEAA